MGAGRWIFGCWILDAGFCMGCARTRQALSLRGFWANEQLFVGIANAASDAWKDKCASAATNTTKQTRLNGATPEQHNGKNKGASQRLLRFFGHKEKGEQTNRQ